MSISKAEQNRRAVFRRDVELERLKKERNELLTRERTARAEAETAQRRLSELASMSKTFASSMRGVTVERQRGRRHLAVQYTVGRLLAESDGLEEAAPGILETIGTGFGWDLGVLWTVDEDTGVLRCDEFWRAPENGRSSVASSRYGFENASRRTILPSGSGLPGRVWARGEALWIENVLEDKGFLRKEAAAGEGLRKAFAFPLRDGSRTLGVIEFFGREAAPPDEDLLRVATLIGIQIGQFLERRRAEEERNELLIRERAARAEAEESRERTREVLESIGDAFFALDHQWRLTYLNDQVVSLTGQSRENLLGKSVLEAFPDLAEDMTYAELIRVEEKGGATQFEHYSSRLDRWLSHRVYPSPTGLSVYTTDITGRKKAENKLRAREEEYRTTFELAGVGKAQTDLETGRFLRVNRRLCEITGYEPEELLARTFTDITHPEDQDREYDGFRRMVCREIDEYETEKRYLRKDGAVVWVRLNATAIRDPEGRPLRTVATIEDITERKRAEEALRKSEERYKTLYEDNPFMYFTVDKRGTVLSVNHSGAEQLGYTVEELVGHRVLDVFHEEDREGASRYLRMCLQNLERPTSWEARKVRKDGSILWVRENLRIVEGPEGDTIGLLICEDITERKQAEEQVLWQAQLLEQVQAAVISTDLQGTVTYWNEHAEKLYGWSREEALGRNIMELTIGPEEAEVAEEIMERLWAGETWAGEFVVRRKDGSAFPAHVTDSLIYDTQGHAVGVIGVSTDMTERKKAEEECERLLAHEWRARAEAEERKRISRELHDRVAHSMGVVHQSLELYEVFKEGKPSQAEAKMKLARETTREALDLTRNISRELHNMEAGDGLSSALSNLLKTAVPPGLESSISVEGDESLIPPRVREQLFLILREAVRNVVSHSEAGQLGIEVRVSPEKVVGCVEDDGRGFEGTSEGDGDNGVPGRGLHSMRERAELVGGTLTLSSAPGSGTKIEASVPLNTNGGGRR